jgi:hypothetical protein
METKEADLEGSSVRVLELEADFLTIGDPVLGLAGTGEGVAASGGVSYIGFASRTTAKSAFEH